MTAIGWLLIITAIALIRAAFKGQVIDDSGKFVLPDYFKDLSEGFLSGDVGRTRTAASAGGVGTDPVEGVVQDAPGTEMTPSRGRPDLLAAAVRRGKAAKGYRFAATGPDWYDCSGLVWRAMQDAYDYKLPRFTSHVTTIRPWSKGWSQVPTPQVGDIVVWRNHHMGIVAGKDAFYSARNPRSGIGYSSISKWKGQGSPIFLRVK